ncbi:GNAT family N-acetyltransferase [Candidatus Pacearchaeota archaeon]|nr:GNAT family N-acetyltransferase [Candidatus Pacearchaeota archaeon]
MTKEQLIKSENTPEEIMKIYQYIKSFNLNYPNYNGWVEKCKKELESGYKKAYYYERDSDILGIIIFQPHKKEKNTLEIKNFRVSSLNKKRGLGSILYNSIEQYAKKHHFEIIQGDTHNKEMVDFLLKKGFKIIKKQALYSPSQIEIILQKNLRNQN